MKRPLPSSSQDFVTDEVTRGYAQQVINFVGFVESLSRVTKFVSTPDKQTLHSYNVSTLEELYQAVQRGEVAQEALSQGGKSVDWQAASAHTAHPPLALSAAVEQSH